MKESLKLFFLKRLVTYGSKVLENDHACRKKLARLPRDQKCDEPPIRLSSAGRANKFHRTRFLSPSIAETSLLVEQAKDRTARIT